MDVSGFPHQVGGHFGLLRINGHICKPLNEREYAFYTQMDERLLPYTPRCCGRVRVHLLKSTEEEGAHDVVKLITSTSVHCHQSIDGNSSSCGAGQPAIGVEEEVPIDGEGCSLGDGSSPQQQQQQQYMTFRLKKCGRMDHAFNTDADHLFINPWAFQCQSKVVQKLLKGSDICFMLLEDMVAQFKRPCVIDLKMGQRQYGDDASDSKQLSQTQKCRSTTSEHLGVRLVGMQLFSRDSNKYTYINKYEGRRMSRLDFFDSLMQFFVLAGQCRTQRLIRNLDKLEATLLSLSGFRFFSSSLLVAYDGEAPAGRHISIRMIDFAHSTFGGFRQEDRVYSGVDDGYILGVRTLMETVKSIHEKIKSGEKAVVEEKSKPLKRPHSGEHGDGEYPATKVVKCEGEFNDDDDGRDE